MYMIGIYGCYVILHVMRCQWLRFHSDSVNKTRFSFSPTTKSMRFFLLGIGCEINATLFDDETEKSNLRTLAPVSNKKAGKTKLKNPNGSCTVNVSSSWYIECLGKKVPLGLHANRTTEMFLLQQRENGAYFIKVRVGLVCRWSVHIL